MTTKIKKILSYLPLVILGVTVLLIFQLGYALANGEVPSIFNRAISYVPTPSMEDEIMAGDIIIIHTKYDELDRGDVISFYANINGQRVSVTHRIEVIGNGKFTTKGDNNDDIIYDWETDVPVDQIIGVYRGTRLPFLGKLYGGLFSDNFNILFLFIILIFVIIIVLEIVNIIKHIHQAKSEEEKQKLIEAAKQELKEKEEHQ